VDRRFVTSEDTDFWNGIQWEALDSLPSVPSPEFGRGDVENEVRDRGEGSITPSGTASPSHNSLYRSISAPRVEYREQ
jgi:hypothetical protein